jgi:2-dehydro-3-deoxyphosphogluconate aldolase/(4S)-4-hydroxy-2-oxoglutarate aldolase
MSLQHVLNHKIIAIIRGASPDDMLPIVNALYEGGIRTVEVTINSPKALKVIEQLSDELGDKMLVGAGTVLDQETARAALLAGARLIVSPTFDAATILMTKKYGALSIPGAMTPTEILAAYTCGGDIIKVFPAGVGPAFFKDMQGPLPHIPLMPTGGVNLDTIIQFQKAGAVAFGLGSVLTDTRQPATPAYLQALTEKAKQFVKAAGPGPLNR